MTTWFTRLAVGAFALATLGLHSCKKDETKVVLQTATAPTLTASTTTPDLVLTTSNAGTTGDTFTYTAADFGFASATTYTLQVDKKGSNFSNAQTLATSSSAGTFTVTKGQLVSALMALGMAPGVATQVDTRVVASVGTTAATQTSSVITLSATPTPVCLPNTTKLEWGLIGSAGAGGWDTDQPLTYDCYSQTFKGTLKLTAGEFKFRANKSWDANLGVKGATGDLTKGVALVSGNDNLKISTPGTYNIVLSVQTDATNKPTGGSVVVKP